MERIDLPKEVINGNGVRHQVLAITLKNMEAPAETFNVQLPLFIDSYKEYHDPKDVRIRALEDELIALKLKHKPARKKRRKLLDGEIKDIKTDIRAGLGNTEIGKEYDCSDSTVSRIRLELRKDGEDV